MKASTFATSLRNEIIKLTLGKQTSISTKVLTQYLDERIPELENAEKHATAVTVDLQTAHYKAKTEVSLEMFASVLDYGKHALNAGMIINAGAAVSLLSFIGNLAARLQPAQVPNGLVIAMFLFVCGVGSAALATGGAYCTQYFYAEEKTIVGIRYHIVTVIFAVSAYLLFFIGATLSFLALRGFVAPISLTA